MKREGMERGPLRLPVRASVGGGTGRTLGKVRSGLRVEGDDLVVRVCPGGRKKAEDVAIPPGTQALFELVDLVRILEVEGMDLEAAGAGCCNDVVACVMVAQLEVFFDEGALATAEAG
jgi:hypothetical protein